MKTRRFFFWTLACFVLIGLIAAWIIFRQPITVHVRIAEDGGFMPDNIKARVSEPLRLRLISDDVEHTFAVGQNLMQPVSLNPEEPVQVTITFDQPGTYTFYSTTPSSLNFWRMRGTIDVAGDEPAHPAEPPLYVRLDLDLDEEHESEDAHVELARQPSASRGAAFETQIASSYLTRDYYVAHSPMEAYEDLRSDPALQSVRNDEVWDVVAFIWSKNISSAALADGLVLYQVNCAACHGESGSGDGQFADEMKAMAELNQEQHGIQAPTDFTEAEHLLEVKPAVLQGLILRGGMGTGMPMWGTIFTEEQSWDLVAYLYSFQFEYRGVNQ